MYLKFFGLDDYPFDGLPDRRFYYVGGSQHQSLTLLTTALSRSGSICVLSGSSGAGKTTLVRMLMRSLPRRMRIISIDDPRLDPHMLLATILRASGVVATSLESIAELTLKLRQMLEKSIAMGIITTVICDEAQGLSDAVLEQIRLISNIEGEAGKMINFLLVGQDDLLTHINKPEHDMLKNRIKIFAVLPRLKEEEVGAYLTYRLQQVSCVKPIFTNRAIAVITKKSQGVPRLINAIADMCLTLAYEKNKQQVNSLIANKAAHIVRYNKVGFKDYVLNLCKELFSVSLYQRLLVIAAAAVCAAGAFVGALYLLERYHPLQTVQEALLTDEQVQNRYQEVASYLFLGKNAESRELYYFNRAISQAYFKSDAFATLVKVNGFAVGVSDSSSGASAGGESSNVGGGITLVDNGEVVIGNDLLAQVGLQSLYQVGSFDEAMSFNTPVLIGLIDDNLTPFYAVLYHINDDVAQLIIGQYLFAVKLDYVRDRYLGSYTLLHPYVGNIDDLKSPKTDVRKAMENNIRPYLEQYRQHALESTNRDANLALELYDEQQQHLEDVRNQLRQQLLATISTEGKSEKALARELEERLGPVLEHSREYQTALAKLKECEDRSSRYEVRADNIRNISLKLDGGYEKAMNLFLEDRGYTDVTYRAIAELTLSFSDGPRLIEVTTPEGGNGGNGAAALAVPTAYVQLAVPPLWQQQVLLPAPLHVTAQDAAQKVQVQV